MENKGPGLALAAVLILAVSCAGGLYYFLHQPPAPQNFSASDFNVSHVDAPQAAAPETGQPQSFAERAASSPAPVSMPGAAPVGFGSSASAPQNIATTSPDQARREREFLSRHGAAADQYQGKMARIGDRYYKASPVVRDVDRAFSAMPRFGAAKARYDRSRNPYQFAREAVALPEVRAEIAKRMKNPQVWGVAIGMMLEAMKSSPPPEVYKEAKRFITTDSAMVDYLPQAGMEAAKNTGAMMKGMPPGADLAPLQKGLHDIGADAAKR